MNISANGLDFLKKREGVELQAYNKDGVWTIGFGNTYYENGQPVKKGDVITLERANVLFNRIASEFATKVNDLLTVILNQQQFDALVSLAYNIGMQAFLKSGVLKKVNQNPNDTTIRNEFLKWIYSQGKQLKGLITRRGLEADLYFSTIVIPIINVPIKTKYLWWITALSITIGVLYFTRWYKIIFNWFKI